VDREHPAVEVDGAAREQAAQHGEALVHPPAPGAGIDAAHLELVRVVTAHPDPEHQPPGGQLRERRHLPRHRDGVAQRQEVHRGVDGKARRHRQRRRLHQPVVAVAVAEAHVVADAEVVEPGCFRPFDERGQRLRVPLERGQWWAHADAELRVHDGRFTR